MNYCLGNFLFRLDLHWGLVGAVRWLQIASFFVLAPAWQHWKEPNIILLRKSVYSSLAVALLLTARNRTCKYCCAEAGIWSKKTMCWGNSADPTVSAGQIGIVGVLGQNHASGLRAKSKDNQYLVMPNLRVGWWHLYSSLFHNKLVNFTIMILLVPCQRRG